MHPSVHARRDRESAIDGGISLPAPRKKKKKKKKGEVMIMMMLLLGSSSR
jgi:hypothetical protein